MTDPAQQLMQLERLGDDVIVRSAVPEDDEGVRTTCHHDDMNVFMVRSPVVSDFAAIAAARHVDGKTPRQSIYESDCLFAVRCHKDRQALIDQLLHQQIADERVVFDYQHAHEVSKRDDASQEATNGLMCRAF